METTKTKKNLGYKKEKQNEVFEQKPLSKMALFRLKYPNGYMGGSTIFNMKAVLK